MLDQQIARLRRRLLEERERLREQYNLIESGMGAALEDSVSELSTYDNHPADLGTEVFERSKDLALREDVRIKMLQIEDALKRMGEGRYGICDVCGREIPYSRLEAIPYTTMCSRCREGPYGEPGLEGHEFVGEKKWDSGYQGASYKFEYPGRGGKGNKLKNERNIVAANKFKSARVDKVGGRQEMRKNDIQKKPGGRESSQAGAGRLSHKGERAAKMDIENIAPLWSGEEATQERDSRRPAEEDVLVPPFEDAIREGTGDIMYDGEDAWQEVARTTEHAEGSQAGAYYGDGELEDEDRGHVEEVDGMPYVKDKDGIIYRKLRGNNDEDGPQKL